MTVSFRRRIIPTLAAIATIAAVGPAAAGENISQVDVTARAPASVRISLTGKSYDTVRQEVGQAAKMVCRREIKVRQLEFSDLQWCSRTSRVKAMRTYAAMRAQGIVTATSVVILRVSAT